MNKAKYYILLLILLCLILWPHLGNCLDVPPILNYLGPKEIRFPVSVSEKMISEAAYYQVYFFPIKELKYAIAFYNSDGKLIRKPYVGKQFYHLGSWKSFDPGKYTIAIVSLAKQPAMQLVHSAGVATKKEKRVIRKESTNVCPPKGRDTFEVYYVLNYRAKVYARIFGADATNANDIWTKEFGEKSAGLNSFPWDGKKNDGTDAGSGLYLVEIQATEVDDNDNVHTDISRVIELD